STSAETTYTASGIIETKQELIVSTREAQVVRTNVNEDRVSTQTNTTTRTTFQVVDPLAQTFVVPSDGGAFITSLDVFFKTKSSNIPVTVQIRPVVNGYPSHRVIPLA